MAHLCIHKETKEICFFSRRRDEPQTPRGRAACPPVHVHQLAECAWPWTRCPVTASLCNHSERKEIVIFKTQGSAPNSRRPCSLSKRSRWLNFHGTSLQPHQNEEKSVFLKTKGSAPKSRRPCSLSKRSTWLNVLGTGPAVW